MSIDTNRDELSDKFMWCTRCTYQVESQWAYCRYCGDRGNQTRDWGRPDLPWYGLFRDEFHSGSYDQCRDHMTGCLNREFRFRGDAWYIPEDLHPATLCRCIDHRGLQDINSDLDHAERHESRGRLTHEDVMYQPGLHHRVHEQIEYGHSSQAPNIRTGPQQETILSGQAARTAVLPVHPDSTSNVWRATEAHNGLEETSAQVANASTTVSSEIPDAVEVETVVSSRNSAQPMHWAQNPRMPWEPCSRKHFMSWPQDWTPYSPVRVGEVRIKVFPHAACFCSGSHPKELHDNYSCFLELLMPLTISPGAGPDEWCQKCDRNNTARENHTSEQHARMGWFDHPDNPDITDRVLTPFVRPWPELSILAKKPLPQYYYGPSIYAPPAGERWSRLPSNHTGFKAAYVNTRDSKNSMIGRAIARAQKLHDLDTPDVQQNGPPIWGGSIF